MTRKRKFQPPPHDNQPPSTSRSTFEDTPQRTVMVKYPTTKSNAERPSRAKYQREYRAKKKMLEATTISKVVQFGQPNTSEIVQQANVSTTRISQTNSYFKD